MFAELAEYDADATLVAATAARRAIDSAEADLLRVAAHGRI